MITLHEIYMAMLREETVSEIFNVDHTQLTYNLVANFHFQESMDCKVQINVVCN